MITAGKIGVGALVVTAATELVLLTQGPAVTIAPDFALQLVTSAVLVAIAFTALRGSVRSMAKEFEEYKHDSNEKLDEITAKLDNLTVTVAAFRVRLNNHRDEINRLRGSRSMTRDDVDEEDSP